MKVTFWGTRGSIAAAGPETQAYGGNTACVQVLGSDGSCLVLDAGTGIRGLGAALPRDVRRIDILLTHLHMDHIQGLGFFEPLFRPRLEVHIWGPPSSTLDLRTRLARYLSPPLFPIRLRDMGALLSLDNAPEEVLHIGPFEVIADVVIHPGPTVGYRIREDGATLAYLPDHEPALGVRAFPDLPAWVSGVDLARDVDLLIHDAQYFPAEREERIGWGHSSSIELGAFARLTRPKRVACFHHDPAHDDPTVDELVAEAEAAGGGIPFVGAREGLTLEV